GVRHPRPRIRPLRHHYAELKRPEPGARRRVLLEEVLDLLIDGDTARPPGRRIRPALDIAREELRAGEQTPHAPHVCVAVAANAVADAVENEGSTLERLQRLQRLLEREVLALFIRPKRVRNNTVWAEDHYQPLLPLRAVGRRQAGQVGNERQH